MADIPIASVPSEETQFRTLGWCREAVEESQQFLKAQKGYEKIEQAINAIQGEHHEIRSNTLSQTTSNRLGKIANDMAALLTDVRPFWDFRTYNRRFERSAEIFGKLSSAWYTQRQIDVKFAEAIKYYLVGGTGWVHPFYNEDTEDLDITAEDPRDVLPVRPSSNLTVQDAVGVIIRRQRTVNYVRQRFPNKAPFIVADRDGSAVSASLANTRAGKLLDSLSSPFRRRLFGDEIARQVPRIPTVDLYTMYVRDDRRNERPYPVVMGETNERGEPATNWSYIVQPGEPLYPRKRCIIFTSTIVLYDGPSVYWHGMFPCCKLTLDPWPWSWLGKAPLWDLLPLQRFRDKLLRVVDDYAEKLARPDLIADKNSVPKSQLDKIDTRRAGLKLQQNPMMGKGVQLVYPAVAPEPLFKMIQMLADEEDMISGVRDMSQMMRLNQLPSAETIEKVMESMSPSVRGRSRSIEAFMREFAMITAYNFAQFYDLPRRLTVLGADGATFEDFDYDPGSMIPDFIHKEDFDERGMPTIDAIMRGPRPRYERARELLRQFTYHVAPGSLLTASQIDEQLKYLQLARAGLIDHWTLLEKMGVPNVGEPPAGTITDRLLAEQQMGLGMQVSSAGRKASGQTMPRMVVKES
jgi:hypothetical protein